MINDNKHKNITLLEDKSYKYLILSWITKKLHRGVEQPGSSLGSMDTKLKLDIAESAVITELLKSAWFNHKMNAYGVDVRRTKTNRRHMLRSRYDKDDFDFAILYRERWDLLSNGLLSRKRLQDSLSNSVKPVPNITLGKVIPSQVRQDLWRKGVETRRQSPELSAHR